MAQFKGADGDDYDVRLSLGSLRRFEKRAGKKLLKVCFGSVRALADKSEDEISDAILDGVGEVFESLDDAARLIYECAVPRDKQAEMDFERFCDEVLSGVAIKGAVQAVFSAIAEQMGASADALALAGGAADPKTTAGE